MDDPEIAADPLSRLRELEAPASALAFVERLPADDAARLGAFVLAAFLEHERRAEQAVREALDHVPRPLRGAARRLLFG